SLLPYLSLRRPTPCSTLFPYTTLFRSSVPIVQIALSSDTLTEQQIFDYANNFIIQRLGTVQGARVPQPWGGKQRQVMVDLDLDRSEEHTSELQSRGHLVCRLLLEKKKH